MNKYNETREINVRCSQLLSDPFMSDLRGFYYEPAQDSRFRRAMTPFMSRGKDMKTSKEMQLKIIDKMRENVENGKPIYAEIEFIGGGRWQDKCLPEFYFNDQDMRIKPQTITINGVEIPKPLDPNEINPGGQYYFMPCLNVNLCTAINGYDGQKFEYKHLYTTKQEAIAASKALFGIKGE